MVFLFEKLEVYQKAMDFVTEVSAITETFPKGNYYLTDQLNRAALSIVTNIAEGNGRWHTCDKKQFFWIARGSLQECVSILELCGRKKLISVQAHSELREKMGIISKMIAGLINRFEKTA